MGLAYSQDDGRLYDSNGVHIATCYAGGNCGENPEGVNNHAMQNVPSIGPLPCGKYRLGEVLQNSHLGPFAIPLIPFPENEMFGRSGFFFHGDTKEMNHSASKGCIIGARSVREEVYKSQGQVVIIEVVEHV
jgi:hypothetical protein